VIEAVLPLRALDLPRAAILARSLECFEHGLRRLWLVGSEEVLEESERLFSGVIPTAPVPETDLVPELGRWRSRFWAWWNRAARPGYRAQQLIKLGIAPRVESAFYLTLDADVILVRDLEPTWLVSDDRGRCVRFDGRAHRNWYRVASEILQLPESRWEHGVTPCLLSRDCVLSLLGHLERGEEAHGTEGPATDVELTGRWRSRLLGRGDWTEYTLYYTFVEASGVFDAHHFAVAPRAWYGGCVWSDAGWASWDPGALFDPDAAFRFSVLQSSTRRSASEIEAELEPYFSRALG